MPDITKSRDQVNIGFTDLADGTFAEQQSMVFSDRARDAVGRLKVSRQQNIYEADFEYGSQPLRWESFTANGASVTHLPGQGGVRMRVPTTVGAICIRQSRPYHRYQPGKTMFMATAIQLGPAVSGNVQRTGFFDDSNGVFFEDSGATAANPTGMGVVIRSDISGAPVDTRVELQNWNGNRTIINQIDWLRIQMLWIEYAWYGAGAVRFGCFIDGQPILFHTTGFGNRPGQVVPWARTGNLPVRYEQRNIATIAAQNDMFHYGVSVMVEGGVDEQRGFTYAYGMDPASPRRSVPNGSTRFPVLTVRNRTMGTLEFTQASAAISAGTTTSMTVSGTPWAVNQWAGRAVAFGAAGAIPTVARITSNTANTLTIQDVVTGGALAVAPAVGNNYTIGLINRGQILPRRLLISANALCTVELISSNATTPVSLTGANFQALTTLGAGGSFAERDVSATALTGGEVVYAFTSPSGAGSDLQQIELQDLFPLYNTIAGNRPDWITVAITNNSGGSALVGAHIIGQEAMS